MTSPFSWNPLTVVLLFANTNYIHIPTRIARRRACAWDLNIQRCKFSTVKTLTAANSLKAELLTFSDSDFFYIYIYIYTSGTQREGLLKNFLHLFQYVRFSHTCRPIDLPGKSYICSICSWVKQKC